MPNLYTYHIHWDGQPQPDATPYTQIGHARTAAENMQDEDVAEFGTYEDFTIVKIGWMGWPHEFETVYDSVSEE